MKYIYIDGIYSIYSWVINKLYVLWNVKKMYNIYLMFTV